VGFDLRKKMLIVDDDPPIRAFLAEIGKFCGFEVDTSDTGRNLAAHMEQTQPDTLILDIVMPDVDGIEALRALAAQAVETRIILISGFDRKLLERAQAMAIDWKLNVVGILEKPLDKNDVIASLISPPAEIQ
jgi:DNA-binding response OmpR family regulator